ncbi:MAG: HAD family hydrolase [Acidobacteria bacterium]|nr:HAD family hydrolase [Acidobacteriota bacterium]
MIDTLFLDAGGVLVHPSWSRVSKALAGEGIAVDAARLAEAEPHAMRVLDEAVVIGATDDQKRGWMYFNLILEQVGIPRSPRTEAALEALAAYHREHNLWEHVDDEVVPALDALRARGLRLVVVSNANGRLGHLFDRLGLARWFDVLLDSHDWGVEKPDPRLFHQALTASGATAERTAHVGDLYHVDVAGARRAGLAHAVLFDAAGLYPGADCPRISRLAELSAWLDGTGAPG